jgi:hypothetical protein
MRITPKIAAFAVAGLALAGPATGTAMAASTASPAPSSPEGESSTESESAVSDGPGGHADAPGNVQYEFNGVQ